MNLRSHQALIRLSILAALATLALKTTAYWLSNSVGLLSEALESIINLAAALIAYVSLWYSSRPVDPSHTYGHAKVEFLSSGLEGLLILLAAVGMAWYAVLRFVAPQPLEQLDAGLVIALAAAAINWVVARKLIRVGHAEHAIILEADGQHLMTDVWTSIAVVAGLVLVRLTGFEALDPLIALAMAGNIVWTGIRLMWRSFDGLMDHALPDDEQAKLRQAIQAHITTDMAFHALRTRRAGANRFVDFHLLVPGIWTVRRAHDLTNDIEQAMRNAFPGLEVTVHIEPIEERSSWEDSALVPLERAAERGGAG